MMRDPDRSSATSSTAGTPVRRLGGRGRLPGGQGHVAAAQARGHPHVLLHVEHLVHAGRALPRSSAGVHLLRRPAALPRAMLGMGTMEVLEDAWAKELILTATKRTIRLGCTDLTTAYWLHGRARPLPPELQPEGFAVPGQFDLHQAAAMLNSSVCARPSTCRRRCVQRLASRYQGGSALRGSARAPVAAGGLFSTRCSLRSCPAG